MRSVTNGNCTVYFEQYKDLVFVHLTVSDDFSISDFRFMKSVMKNEGKPLLAAIDTGDDKLKRLLNKLGFTETEYATVGSDSYLRRVYSC